MKMNNMNKTSLATIFVATLLAGYSNIGIAEGSTPTHGVTDASESRNPEQGETRRNELLFATKDFKVNESETQPRRNELLGATGDFSN